uniref:uncharacterized protein LOC120339106 n=1 Tax=Styela clava TaxID=7725 RepID=UPI00193A53CC|nr:uncharacterized protein LOC120339106 [Styela clava]
MASVLVFVLATLLCFDVYNMVNACSCQPEHPQNLYCKSEFVIKALVGKARLVELGNDGKYRRIHKHKPDKEDSSESSGFADKISHETEENSEVSTVNILNEDANEESDPMLVVERVLPYPLTNEKEDDTEPAAGISSAAAFKRRRRARTPVPYTKRTAIRLKNRLLRNFLRHRYLPPGAPSRQATPEKKLMMQYKISIVKTFKGLENVTKQQRAYMYTPPRPLCNMRLTTSRSPFLLMGNMQDGVMVIRECDYKIDLSKLSEGASKNLIRNMRFRFGDGCKSCHIKVCNMGGCGPLSDRQPFQCKWREWWTVQTPGASQFACVRGKSGKCHWYNSGNKHAKQSDITLSYSR